MTATTKKFSPFKFFSHTVNIRTFTILETKTTAEVQYHTQCKYDISLLLYEPEVKLRISENIIQN